jgi:hypothetical protein
MVAVETLTFDEIRHTYQLEPSGMILPSVSKILRESGLAPDLSQIPPAILETARRRGIAVHAIAEVIDGGGDPDIEPGLEPYADAYRLFLRESGYRPEKTEHMVYHPELLYAGRLDSGGWMNQQRFIIDRKATADMDRVATPVQLAAYTGAYLAMTPGEHVEMMAGLHLRRDGTYRLHVWDFESYWETWQAPVKIYRHKRQHRKEKK